MTTRQKGIDKFVNLEFPPYITYGACTTISVYENLSKNSFFIRIRKPTPPVCRSCSRFASAKVELFHKLAKKRERFFKKMKKKECKTDNNNRKEGEYTLLYIIYIGNERKQKRRKQRKQRRKRKGRNNKKARGGRDISTTSTSLVIPVSGEQNGRWHNGAMRG